MEMPPKKSNLNNSSTKQARHRRIERRLQSPQQILKRNETQRIKTAESRAHESQEHRNERLLQSRLRTRAARQQHLDTFRQRERERQQTCRAKKKLSNNNDLASQPKKNNEDDTIARSWVSQCKQMEASQQTIARKLISDVLFNGCVGSLQMEYVIQVNNIFNGTNVVPDHVLKELSNTSTPISTSMRSYYEEYSHSAQSQSTGVVYEHSDETVISPSTASEQFIDTGKDLDLAEIKEEFLDEE